MFVSLYALTAAGLTAAVTSPLLPVLQKRACGETSQMICFGENGGTPQNINVDDIAYAAQYLRNIALDNEGTPGAFWTMPPSTDCEEWQLPLAFGETVMTLAKHINPRYNSSVLFSDIADTIDGGEEATDAQRAASLLGRCGAQGGMAGVKFDANNPAYNTDAYKKSRATPDHVLIKIVHAPL